MYKVADLWNGNPDRGDKYKRAIMKAVSLRRGFSRRAYKP